MIIRGVVGPLLAVMAVAVASVGCREKNQSSAPPTSATASASPSAKTKNGPTAEFWAWFEKNAQSLHDDADLRHTMETIGAQLETRHPGVFAEIGQDGDERLLVITADGKKDLFPVVQAVYAARPTVPGWKIVAFRQRSKPEDMMAIEMNGKKLDPKTMQFVAHKNGDLLDLKVFIPGFTKLEDYGTAPYIVLDHTIGEYDMETKIGAIVWAAAEKGPKHARPLTELPAVVDEAFPPK
jgi:hypothetical protein